MSGTFKITEKDFCGECLKPFCGIRAREYVNYPCECAICDECYAEQVKYCNGCEYHVYRVVKKSYCNKEYRRKKWTYNKLRDITSKNDTKSSLLKKLTDKNLM